MYLNPIQSLPWDKHTQQGNCPCLYCLKIILSYQKELCELDYAVTENCDTEKQQSLLGIYLNVWYRKKSTTSTAFKTDK